METKKKKKRKKNECKQGRSGNKKKNIKHKLVWTCDRNCLEFVNLNID